jgi:hypothetical protein
MTTTTLDLYPVHRWIADHFFEGQGWIYNGAATDVTFRSGVTGKVYVCRARDMRPGRHGQSYIAIQHFDDDWNAKSLPKLLPIITANPETLKMDTGPQDARIFVFRGHIWVVFNMLCGDGYRRMHIYSVTGGRNTIPIRIDGQDRSKAEKNWTPFVFNEELFFIYYFAPLVILRCDVSTGNCVVVFSNNETRNSYLRGGSPALQTAEDRTHFYGYLHTTIPLRGDEKNKFDASELPTPAKDTPNVYRARRFDLIFGKQGVPPKIMLGPELIFQGKQIEQVYGLGVSKKTQQVWGILNINDKQTVVLEPVTLSKTATSDT